jgi:glycosyltransferase involved in cell wall biosynthesis
MNNIKLNPIISIIIPVYNTDKYLANCINSVLSQSFTDFECILIDDGSSDKSSLICDDYAKKDSRIIVIHKTNGGVSSARNAGLDIAQGEWITFIDSDDWVENKYIEIMYNNAIKFNCDLSSCGLKKFSIKGDLLDINKQYPILFFDKISAKKALFEFKYYGTGTVIKLVKKQFITYNNIRFDNKLKVCEDGLFWFQVIDKLQKVVYDSTPYYNYIIHDDSLTNSPERYENYKSNFTATRKMINTEKNISVICAIKSFNAHIARDICISLLNSNNIQKNIYNFYRNQLFITIYYLLFDIKKDFYFKIITILLLFPKLYLLAKTYNPLYKKIKLSIKKILLNK